MGVKVKVKPSKPVATTKSAAASRAVSKSASASSKTVGAKATAVSSKAPAVSSRSAGPKAAGSKVVPVSKSGGATKKGVVAPAPKTSELRSILEDLRVRTLKEIKEKVKSGTSATSQEIGDMYDQASEERDRELDLLLGDRERGKLLQIDEAFLRLKEGTYGQCEDCGEPINPKRLRIVPFTRTCVDCQTDKENEERLMRDRDVDAEKIYTVQTSDAPSSTDEDD